LGRVTAISPRPILKVGALDRPMVARIPFILVDIVTPEKDLIAEIRKLARTTVNPSIRTGIGDDCAVLRLSGGRGRQNDTLVTTDFSLEGIHFRRDSHPPDAVGHRCLARGLSDIAAMGGDPVAAFLSLALPGDLPPNWERRFIRGLIALAKKYGVTLAGGDTAESSGGILADIVVLGVAPRGTAVLRSKARPGDLIYVSGELGGSAAAVRKLGNKSRVNPRAYPRHFFPEPRITLGRALREKSIASAMIDTSDGLSTDLAHICEESGVGAELLSEAVPLAQVGKPRRTVDLELALHGGEDYELLFTAPRSRRVPSQIAGVSITQIGRITRERMMFLINRSGVASKLEPRGWEHFRK
jgi:thiamine-monophosphate kinase